MKHIAIIGTILILLILTTGCLDDLSSTLPPCCDGTCDGVKTSVITVDKSYEEGVDFSSGYFVYVKDADGLLYAWKDYISPLSGYGQYKLKYDPYNNHNVTFSYEMVNGHRHITGIIEDHDAEPKCDCCQCVQKCCGCE